MLIDKNEIKKICSSTIYKRGADYYREGRVHIKSRSANEFTATVDGTERYSVHAEFDNGKIVDTLCTCPYYRTMGCACKHIVAALLLRCGEEEACEKFENENDRLASLLCDEFSAFQTEFYRIGVVFFITPSYSSGEHKYEISLRLYKGNDAPTPVSGKFITALCENNDFLLSKNMLFRAKKSRFDESSEKILNLLKMVRESEGNSLFYAPEPGNLRLGKVAAKEMLRLCRFVDTEYVIDGVSYKNPVISEGNPDILLDVFATDKSITVSQSDGGLALVPDGSVFFFENRIYFTDEEWRQWFMPFYRAMTAVGRTQLEFSGKNGVDFAAKVLSNIKSKRGVVCYNTEDLIVCERPKFEIYVDTFKNGISATVKALYGSIPATFPKNSVDTDKILVRDEESEKGISEYFSAFSVSGEKYILTDEEEIFEFISRSLPELEEKATIYASDSFSSLSVPLPQITPNISYNEKIDLLELSAESTLSDTEIAEILKAYANRQSYYRLKNGAFLDFGKERERLDFLSEISGISGGRLKTKKTISKYYTLYLAGKAEENLVTADKAFSGMVSAAMHTYAKIPDYLKSVLRDYQKSGVHWMKQLSRMGLGGILADDMGLGKTIQVIAFVMSEKAKLPALIAVPSSLTYNWLNEINKFAPGAKALIIDGTKPERDKLLTSCDRYDFVITSYALLRRDAEEYAKLKFSFFFADEAQHIKNARTKLARTVKSINAERCFALTGTPIENSLSELWSIFDFVMHGYLPPYAEFTARCEKMRSSALNELKSKVKPFILRRMKKDVLSELPEKIESTVFAEFESEQKDIYSAFLAAARNEVEEISASGDGTIRILSLLTRLRQICCHPRLINPDYKKDSGKLELLRELVASATEGGHRILIFSQFTSMLNIIADMLVQNGISYFYLDGSTRGFERTDMASRFNSGEKQVFLISLRAGGTGLNLTGADTVIHFDPWWNPAAVDQASDRAYRIGQTKAVRVIKLVTKNSIEEQIMKLSEQKRALADNIITENKSLLSSLSKKELLELFDRKGF